MIDHLWRCPVIKNPDAACQCDLIEQVQSDEQDQIGDHLRTYEQEVRERIAQAIEADRDGLTRRIKDQTGPYWSPDAVDQWTSERVALNRAARIARNGGLGAALVHRRPGPAEAH